MPRLQQLRYLVALSDTLSFSRAADLCHVTQPTLSMQIKELEERLGAVLVERSRSKVFLTPLGQEVSDRARRVLAEVSDIRTLISAQNEGPHGGMVQMGVVPTVGAYVLSLAMPDLRRNFAQLRIQVREERAESLRAQLADGRYDVLLLPDRPTEADFNWQTLIHEPFMLVLPADHRLASHTRINPIDLAGETVLAMERDERLAQLCTRVGAKLTGDYAGTSLDTLRQMVAAGMGVSFLPALYVRSEVLREKLVVARPIHTSALHPVPIREICLIWRKASPKAQVWEDLAKSIGDSLRPWDSLGEDRDRFGNN